MSKRTRRLLIAGCLLFGALILSFWLITRPEPLPPLPDPNGYDRLIAAAGNIKITEPLMPQPESDIDDEALRFTVEINREVLAATRDALELPARIPLSKDLQSDIRHTSHLRQLARLLIATGKLAEHEGRISDAATNSVDAVRLGHAVTRGAFFLYMLVGVAIESTGHNALLQLAPKLDASTAQQVSQQLADLEQGREPFEATLAAERRWTRIAIPWTDRFLLTLSSQGKKLKQPAVDAGLAAHRRVRALTRLVILKIALHQFHQQQGQFPERLDELSLPDLPDATTDPYTDKPLVYRRENGAYQLYSVGPNQQDEQGQGPDPNAATQTSDDISAWPEGF